MKTTLNLQICAVSLLLIVGGQLLLPNPVHGWKDWSPNCAECHGAFNTSPYVSPWGETWPESLHTVHSGSTFMNTSCEVCHTGVGGPPKMNESSINAYGTTPGYGCAGCHGREDSGVPTGKGLRNFHRNNSIHYCWETGCHHRFHESPEPENINPPNYGGSLTNADDSCNHSPEFLEDYSGDDIGLDNDGDRLYDIADPDCLITPTFTATLGPSPTPTSSPSGTVSPVSTNTPSPTSTLTHTFLPTDTATPSPTFTNTLIPTNTTTTRPTSTFTHTFLPTGTATPSPTFTDTLIPTNTPTTIPTSTFTLNSTYTPTDHIPEIPEGHSGYILVLIIGLSIIITGLGKYLRGGLF